MKACKQTYESNTVSCILCDNNYSNNKCLQRHMKSKHPTLNIIRSEFADFMVLENDFVQSKKISQSTDNITKLISNKTKDLKCTKCEKSFLRTQF